MKRIILITIVIISGVIFSANAQEKKITAAVMDLEAKEGISAGLVSTLSDYFRTQLVNTNEFTMVTRENMQEILKEQKFQLSGCTSKECIVEVGQLLGVRKIFAGSIGKAGATYVLNIKLIDVQSGKIEKATTEECAKCEEDTLLVSVKNITGKITGIGVAEKAEEKQTKPKEVTEKKTAVTKTIVIPTSAERKEVEVSRPMGIAEKNMLAKANQLYEQGKYDDALGAYQELRDKYIDNALAWYGMGAVFYANKMYDKAIDRFQTAIKLDPNLTTAMHWLGNAYEKKGNKQEAAKYRKMALGKDLKTKR